MNQLNSSDGDTAPNILFYGTTSGLHNKSLQDDGRYVRPDNKAIWMDQNTFFSRFWAKNNAEDRSERALLLIIDSTLNDVRRPSKEDLEFELGPWKPGYESLIASHRNCGYWTTDILTRSSFVTYDLSADELEMFEVGGILGLEREIEGMKELCKPFGVVPEYIVELERPVER